MTKHVSTRPPQGSIEPARRAEVGAFLLTLIVSASLLGAVSSAASFLAQTTSGSGPARMTVIVAMVTLAEAAGAMVAALLAILILVA